MRRVLWAWVVSVVACTTSHPPAVAAGGGQEDSAEGEAGGGGGGALVYTGGTGGSASGGAAGGDAGGDAGGGEPVSCLGAPAGAYVCQGCPGASDSNTGTASCPVSTIRVGIEHAVAMSLGTVTVASRYEDIVFAYTEDLLVPGAVVLEGGSEVRAANVWSAATGRTVLHAAGATAVRFTTGATGGLKQFSVYATVTGIAMTDAAPTLSYVDVLGVSAVAHHAGVEIRGTGTSRPQPRLDHVDISHVSSSGDAIGLRIAHAQPELVAVTTSAAASTAIGAQLEDAAGTTWNGGSAKASSASVCYGVRTLGDNGGVLLDGVDVRGCEDGAGGPVFTQGLAAQSCPQGAAALRFVNGTVHGGIATSARNGYEVRGVTVADRCVVQLDRSTVIGASAEVPVGAGIVAVGVAAYSGRVDITRTQVLASTSHGGVRQAVGIRCWDGACGTLENDFIRAPSGLESDSLVSLSSSTIISDTAFTATAGVVINNIFQGTVVSSGAPAALWNNDFFMPDGGPLYRDGAAEYLTLAELELHTGGAGNVSVDPQFGPEAPHLSATSPLRGAGTTPGPSVDLDNEARPQPAGSAPDIGADERP